MRRRTPAGAAAGLRAFAYGVAVASGPRDTVPTLNRDEAAAIARPELRARAVHDVTRFSR
jgi:hypothetical protein